MGPVIPPDGFHDQGCPFCPILLKAVSGMSDHLYFRVGGITVETRNLGLTVSVAMQMLHLSLFQIDKSLL